jgi:hypothetical protein
MKNFIIQLGAVFTGRLLFWSCLILAILPFAGGLGFPSYDGPAHLYNVYIFDHLFWGKSSVFDDLFQINEQLVPNYFGHLLLWLLFWMFKPLLAEKVFFFCMLLLFAFGFRKLQSVGVDRPNPIFPFAGLILFLAFPLGMGFYNFILAIGLLFFTLALVMEPLRSKIMDAGVLFLLFSLLFLSHFMIYGLALGMIGLWFILQIYFEKRIPWARILAVIVALIPSLFGAFIYIKSRTSQLVGNRLPLRELVGNLIQGDGLATFAHEELFLLTVLFWLLILVSVGSWLIKSGKNLTDKTKLKLLYGALLPWVLLCLYLVLPDSNQEVAYISKRLNYLIMIFLFLSATMWGQHLPSKWMIIVSILMLAILPIRILQFSKVHYRMDRIVKEIMLAEEMLPEQAVVLPLDASHNWLIPHYSNYLGIKKPVLVLENYEASNSYFPVRWKFPLPGYRVVPGTWVNALPNFEHLILDQENPRWITHIYVQIPYKNADGALPPAWEPYFTKVFEGDYLVLFERLKDI